MCVRRAGGRARARGRAPRGRDQVPAVLAGTNGRRAGRGRDLRPLPRGRRRLESGGDAVQDPGPVGPQRADAGAGVRIGRDPAVPGGEVRRRLPPTDTATRAECLSWLFWQMGAAPFLGGGFGHFYAYAPTKIEYAIDRYAMEVKRQLDVLDRRLAESAYLAGADYSIADIAVWPWYGALAKGLLYGAGEFLQVQDYHHVQRWTEQIAQRPAVKRGRMVNRTFGQPASQLHERHDAADFDTRTQDKL